MNWNMKMSEHNSAFVATIVTALQSSTERGFFGLKARPIPAWANGPGSRPDTKRGLKARPMLLRAMPPKTVLVTFALALFTAHAFAQLIPEPPLEQHKVRHGKQRGPDLEWLWQYGPPPEGGREHELLQDPNFQDFLHDQFKAPQTFWGPQNGDPKDPNHKSLAETVFDFLSIPGTVIADQNRYITASGCVFHFCPSRGMIFADLDGGANPLVAFAAIQWIRSDRPTSDPAAEYTLWIFPNQPLKSAVPGGPISVPAAFLHALVRWMKTPMAGSGIVQNVTAAVLVDPDGTPHQIPVPKEGLQ
jgi:hypothetical protein